MGRFQAVVAFLAWIAQAEATGSDKASMRAAWKTTGDLGDVAIWAGWAGWENTCISAENPATVATIPANSCAALDFPHNDLRQC